MAVGAGHRAGLLIADGGVLAAATAGRRKRGGRGHAHAHAQ